MSRMRPGRGCLLAASRASSVGPLGLTHIASARLHSLRSLVQNVPGGTGARQRYPASMRRPYMANLVPTLRILANLRDPAVLRCFRTRCSEFRL